jgi:putative FmdB family regulatory protein
MPVYEFACKRCGARFEELVSAANNGPRLLCPRCGSAELERLFSPFATDWKPSNVNWHRIP